MEGEDSLANTGEAVTTLDLVTGLLGAGLAQENIRVISPYWAQVATIRLGLMSQFCTLLPHQVTAIQ